MMTMRDLVRKGILRRVHPWHEQNVAEIIERSPLTQGPCFEVYGLLLECQIRKRREAHKRKP